MVIFSTQEKNQKAHYLHCFYVFRAIKIDYFTTQACIFDWAGTVCDPGVFAPVLTFQKLFEDEGVPITSEEVRAPMGVHKRVSFNSVTN